MRFEDYQKYTYQTVLSYPKKWRDQLMHSFLDEQIANFGSQLTLSPPHPVDISGLELDDQLKCCIENENRDISEKCLSIIEKWEFGKDYKYSVIFQVDDFPGLLATVEQKCVPFQNAFAELHSDFQSPQLLNSYKHVTLIKFNRRFEAIHPITGEEMLIRYPVVVALHKNEEVAEIRFDSLKRFFMDNADDFYAHVVDDICNIIKNEFGQNMTPLNLDFLVQMLRDSSGEALLVAESMKMSNGSYAELRVEKNKEYVLPFIGELKDMLSEYASEFETVPNLKEAFEQFIFEKEVTSDYPWIELLWKNEINTVLQ